MVVGVCRVALHLPENRSLKGKRQVVKSIIERVRSRFGVSIAEVEGLDLWQSATLGISFVSNEGSHAREVLSRVVAFISTSRAEAEVTQHDLEILPFP